MRSSKVFRAGGAAAILALTLVLAGCGTSGAPDNEKQQTQSQVGQEQATADAAKIMQEGLKGQEGKDERVFGTSRDDVLSVVETTFSTKNAKAQWDRDVVRVELDGSAEGASASIPCMAIEALLTDGEEAVLNYSDGEFRCSEREK